MLVVSSLFSFFFAHFTIYSCEWSCSLPFTICIDDHGSFVICRADSVRPNHLSDQNFDHVKQLKFTRVEGASIVMKDSGSARGRRPL